LSQEASDLLLEDRPNHAGNTFPTISSSSTIDTTTNRKRKKSYYRRKNPFLKILKRDIRRDFPRMVTNMLNCQDPDLISRFFHHICVPSCFYIDYSRGYQPHPPSNNDSSSVSSDTDSHHVAIQQIEPVLESIEALIQVLVLDQSVFPDMTTTLKGAQLKQSNAYHGTKIVLNYLVQGTKLFHNNICEQHVLPSVSADTAEYIASLSKEVLITQKIPLPQPLHLTMLVMITLTLNEEHLCTGIEMQLAPGTQPMFSDVLLPPPFL